MAGDILIYQTDLVPIGDDQRQHLELARDVAERFNSRFGETFKRARRGSTPRSARGSWIYRSRARRCPRPAAPRRARWACSTRRRSMRKKFKSAVTDSGSEVRHDPRGEAGHLEPDRDHVRRDRRGDPRRSRRATTAQGYGQFKEEVGEAVVALLGPIQQRYQELRADERELQRAPRPGRREGARGLRADARADVRAHGLRPAVADRGQRRPVPRSGRNAPSEGPQGERRN